MTAATVTVQRLVLEHFPTAGTARVLSPNGRAHWARKHQATQSVRGIVATHAAVQRLAAMRGLVEIQPTFVYPVARKRDDDNLGTGVMKAVRDALVDRGYLEADDMEHVRQLRPRVEVQSGRRALILEFREWWATGHSGGDESEKVNDDKH